MKTIVSQLSQKDLHSNYLLLLRFLHPEDPIKKWVEEEESYTGAYHQDIGWIWPAFEKMEALGCDITISRDNVKICVAIRGRVFSRAFYCGGNGAFNSKLESMYVAAVSFAGWLLESHPDIFQGVVAAA